MKQNEQPEPSVSVNVNAYLTIEEASDISAQHLFTAHWNNASITERKRAIITATALLDRMRWAGRKLAPTQKLEWPRVALRAPSGFPLAIEVPSEVRTATAELAIHLLSTGELNTKPIMQQMLGDSMVMYYPTVADEIPKHVRRLIEPYLIVSSANVAEVQL